MELGIFAPNISGGPRGGRGCPFVISRIPTSTDWRWDYNYRLARMADEAGFAMYFMGARWRGHGEAQFHGYQLEACSMGSALAAVTNRIKLISTVHTGLWHPGVMAKIGATIDNISNGRWVINIVSGWVKDEYDMLGVPWLEHDDRYAMSREFIAVLKGLWTEERFDFTGRFFNFRDGYLQPKPVQKPYPEIINAGVSPIAKRMTAELCDWYFSSSFSLDQLRAECREVKSMAAELGRKVRVVTYAFVLCRETSTAAQNAAAEVMCNADYQAAAVFANRLLQQTFSPGRPEYSEPPREMLDALILGLGARPIVGSPSEVAEGLRALDEAGADCVLLSFLDYIEELPFFCRTVVPLLKRDGTSNLSSRTDSTERGSA